MLCENCGEREATIHEVLIDASNTKYEKHLCELCASGGPAPSTSGEPASPVSELISKFMVGGPAGPALESEGDEEPGKPEESAKPSHAKSLACEACGMTYTVFKQTGLLGCPACYTAFETRIGPLIERAHEGGSHHVGKIPKRALEVSRSGGRIESVLGDQAERIKRIAELRKSLQVAVTGERYEQAAELKLEIERLQTLSDGGGA